MYQVKSNEIKSLKIIYPVYFYTSHFIVTFSYLCDKAETEGGGGDAMTWVY